MRSQISGFELSYIISEMQFMIDGKVDKIFQPQKDEFLFRFHVPGHGKALVRILLPNLAYMSTRKKDSPGHPSGFCMYLRKRLSGARIRSISQLAKERIIIVAFETKDAIYKVIIELFGKGNLIVCDADEKMLSLHKSQEWKDRSMKVGMQYKSPPSRPDVSRLSSDDISSLISSSTHPKIVKSLATDLGLGGTYAQELCIRAGIDQSLKPAEVDPGKLYEAFQRLINEPLNPAIIRSGEDLIEIVPFPLQLYKGYDLEEVSSFNQALDMIFSQDLVVPLSSQTTQKLSKEQLRLQRIIQDQEQIAQKHEVLVQENEAKAHAIYAHYQQLHSLLLQYSQKKDSLSSGQIKELLLSDDLVKDLDLKDKTVTVELNT